MAIAAISKNNLSPIRQRTYGVFSLTYEVAKRILGELSPEEVIRFGKTCKFCQDLSNYQNLWKYLYQRDFGLIEDSGEDFRKKYKTEYSNIRKILAMLPSGKLYMDHSKKETTSPKICGVLTKQDYDQLFANSLAPALQFYFPFQSVSSYYHINNSLWRAAELECRPYIRDLLGKTSAQECYNFFVANILKEKTNLAKFIIESLKINNKFDEFNSTQIKEAIIYLSRLNCKNVIDLINILVNHPKLNTVDLINILGIVVTQRRGDIFRELLKNPKFHETLSNDLYALRLFVEEVTGCLSLHDISDPLRLVFLDFLKTLILQTNVDFSHFVEALPLTAIPILRELLDYHPQIREKLKKPKNIRSVFVAATTALQIDLMKKLMELPNFKEISLDGFFYLLFSQVRWQIESKCINMYDPMPGDIISVYAYNFAEQLLTDPNFKNLSQVSEMLDFEPTSAKSQCVQLLIKCLEIIKGEGPINHGIIYNEENFLLGFVFLSAIKQKKIRRVELLINMPNFIKIITMDELNMALKISEDKNFVKATAKISFLIQQKQSLSIPNEVDPAPASASIPWDSGFTPQMEQLDDTVQVNRKRLHGIEPEFSKTSDDELSLRPQKKQRLD